MSNAVLKGNASGTGTVTIETPNTNSDFTISLPAATGTAMVSGNMPAFSAYAGTTQTLSSGVVTKILFNTEIFDTNNNFASSTFTPTVAGYYQVNALLNVGVSATRVYMMLYKNGSVYQSGPDSGPGSAIYSSGFNTVVYCNGTTDYLEMYGAFASGQATSSGSTWVWFNAAMVRGA